MSTSVFQLVEFNNHVVDLDNTSIQLDAKSIQVEVGFSASEFVDKFGMELSRVFSNPEHTFYFLNQEGGVVSAKLERVSEISANKFKTRFTFAVSNWNVEIPGSSLTDYGFAIFSDSGNGFSKPYQLQKDNLHLIFAKFVRCGYLVLNLSFPGDPSRGVYCAPVKLTTKAINIWRSFCESGDLKKLLLDVGENLPKSHHDYYDIIWGLHPVDECLNNPETCVETPLGIGQPGVNPDLPTWQQFGWDSVWGNATVPKQNPVTAQEALDRFLKISLNHFGAVLTMKGFVWNGFVTLFEKLDVKTQRQILAPINNYAMIFHIGKLLTHGSLTGATSGDYCLSENRLPIFYFGPRKGSSQIHDDYQLSFVFNPYCPHMVC
jgi:hypothetical protein